MTNWESPWGNKSPDLNFRHFFLCEIVALFDYDASPNQHFPVISHGQQYWQRLKGSVYISYYIIMLGGEAYLITRIMPSNCGTIKWIIYYMIFSVQLISKLLGRNLLLMICLLYIITPQILGSRIPGKVFTSMEGFTKKLHSFSWVPKLSEKKFLNCYYVSKWW